MEIVCVGGGGEGGEGIEGCLKHKIIITLN